MAPTTAETVKNTRKPCPLQFPTRIDSNKGIFNRSNHHKSSSKTQIAAYSLMILAVAEGGIPLGKLRNHRKTHQIR
jgi:hypothetical protein